MFRMLQRLWRRLVRGRTRAERSKSEAGQPAGKDGTGRLVEDDRHPVTEHSVEPSVVDSGRKSVTSAPTTVSRPNDDLTVIKGIGPATKRRLQVAGIRSYEDLAQAAPQEIHRALLGSRRGANVQQWIDRARQLSQQRESVP